MKARTYRSLSERRTGEERAVLLQLEETERCHEEYWLAHLGGHALPALRPSLRTRATSVLAHLFGTIFILAMTQRVEQRSTRDADDDVPAYMQADGHAHTEITHSLAVKSRETLADTFRAAVFGASDGLMSNLTLVLGVTATGMEPRIVLLTGISDLLAGVLSMGTGEWMSMHSQREPLDVSTPDPDAHQAAPGLNVDTSELTLVFRARGESEEGVERYARQVFVHLAKPADGKSGAIAVRAALGGSPESDNTDNQVGAPVKTTLSSFYSFTVGTSFPLIPYLLGIASPAAIVIATVIAGVALPFTSGAVGIPSGQPPTPRALRRLTVGHGAVGITYLLD